jgi:hypothetical protein
VLEVTKQLIDRFPQFGFDCRNGDIGREWRHRVLEFVQFRDPGRRQEIGAGAQHLPQFDERRTEVGQRQAEALRTADRIGRRTTHDPTRHREESCET